MERKAYQKPTMTVVVLQEYDILAVSEKKAFGENFMWDLDS